MFWKEVNIVRKTREQMGIFVKEANEVEQVVVFMN